MNDSLRQAIDKGLPRRPLRVLRDDGTGALRKVPVHRGALITKIGERCELWLRLQPQMGAEIIAHSEKLKRAAKVVADLRAHAEATVAELEADAINSPIRMLYVACRGALVALSPLERWTQVYQPRKGARRQFGPELAADLQSLCRLVGGLRKFEVEQLFDALSEKHGLPRLSLNTLKMRRYRAKKR